MSTASNKFLNFTIMALVFNDVVPRGRLWDCVSSRWSRSRQRWGPTYLCSLTVFEGESLRNEHASFVVLVKYPSTYSVFFVLSSFSTSFTSFFANSFPCFFFPPLSFILFSNPSISYFVFSSFLVSSSFSFLLLFSFYSFHHSFISFPPSFIISILPFFFFPTFLTPFLLIHSLAIS